MSSGIVLASGTAALANTKLSLAANYSFFDIGVDLSQFIGNTIEITNATAPKYSIRGVISTVGTGETLGSELITSWTNYSTWPFEAFDGSSPPDITSAINSTSTALAYTNSLGGNIGKLLKLSFTLTLNSGNLPYRYTEVVRGTGSNGLAPIIASSGSNEEYFVPTTDVSVFELAFSANTATNFSVASTALKQVLTPSSTGHWIKSAPGATDGVAWSYKHASFNPNDSAGFTYRILSTNIPGKQIASGTVSATDVKLATVDGGAMVEITGVDLSPYAGVDSFSPPSTNLQLHLKADAGCFTDAGKTTPCASDSDKVYTWADQSGNGYDFVQSTEAKRPLYKTSIVGSLPAIRFDGSSDYMSASSGLGMLRNVAGATIYAVAKRSGASPSSASQIIVIETNSGGLTRASLAFTNSTELVRVGGRRLDADAFQSVGVQTSTTGTNYIVSGVLNYIGTKINAYVNGLSKGYTTAFQTTGNTQDADSSQIGIGALVTAPLNSYLNGDIYEILIYNAAHDDITRTQIERYLAGKWGISYTPTVYGTSPAKYLLALYDSSNKVAVGYVGDSNATTITAVNLHSTNNAYDRKMKIVSSGFDSSNITKYKIYALTGGENIPFMYLENNLQLQDEGNGYIYSKEG